MPRFGVGPSGFPCRSMALSAARQGQILAERDVVGGVPDSQPRRIVIDQFRLRMVFAQDETEAGQRTQAIPVAGPSVTGALRRNAMMAPRS